jgi:DNA-binding LytR/AlgR family response regulator
VDDEENAVQHVVKYIAKVPFLKLAQSFTNPLEALHYLQQHPVDLVFLDVQMPEYDLDGIDFLEMMGNKSNFILATAHTDYAMIGYEHNIIDYLHKPFSFERFVKAAQKALPKVPETKPVNPMDGYLFIRTESRSKLQKVYFHDIYWIESDRNYVSIYTGNDRITTQHTIKDLEEQLPKDCFLRVHKSFLISLDKVTAVEKDEIIIHRAAKDKAILLGESYRKVFFSVLKDKILMKKNTP